MPRKQRILLTGATGNGGGKLLKRRERDGHEINCLVRDPSKLKHTGVRTTMFQGDVLDISSMVEPFKNVATAYFLVHFLNEKNSFEAMEMEAAETAGLKTCSTLCPQVLPKRCTNPFMRDGPKNRLNTPR
jgi:uncharacterized protein YbjT (DUF2867 family)